MTDSGEPPVGVVGAGMMGAGIAQVAAVAGRAAVLAACLASATKNQLAPVMCPSR